MQKLIEGLRQFVHTVEGEERELFAQLATGQQPDVLFVTCSDSRIAPHKMTQTGPGDLFVIRNAGNIVPPYGSAGTGEAATVEYAAAALGVKDIIVCGHSNCGAMGGLMSLADLEAKMPTVHKWLQLCEPTRRIVEQQLGDLDDKERLERAIELNVLAQLNNLRTHPSVAARLYGGDLRLHGWVYDIGSGHVHAFDSESGTFVSIIDSSPSSSKEGRRGLNPLVA